MRKTWKNTIGFLSPEKAKFCEHVIKEHVTQDSVCLEIGTYCGKSTLHLIEYGNPKKIITIDNYTELQSTAGLPDVFEENILDIPTAKISNPKAYTFENNEKLFADYPQVELIKGHTPLKLKLPILDYIYIVCGHTYEQKVADLEWVFQYCKDGTVIVLDDWFMEDVQNAIKYFCKEYKQSYVISEPNELRNTMSKIVIKNA
jgi:precorrin-6B methylase 2